RATNVLHKLITNVPPSTKLIKLYKTSITLIQCCAYYQSASEKELTRHHLALEKILYEWHDNNEDLLSLKSKYFCMSPKALNSVFAYTKISIDIEPTLDTY
ncbi:hypothetical protein ACJX0J_007673, partial [Zea mays]